MPCVPPQYLEMRYGTRWVRCTASGMYVVQMILYQAVVIYAPALAIASVTDFPLWVSVITVGVIASVYTAIVSVDWCVGVWMHVVLSFSVVFFPFLFCLQVAVEVEE